MDEPWTADTRRRLLDTSLCPRCGSPLYGRIGCETCGAVLSGHAGVEVWRAAVGAARALVEFEQAVAALSSPVNAAPSAGGYVSAGDRHPSHPSTATTSEAPSTTADARPESRVSVQSVLAVAGAGLVAVAAIVFTFFSPDLRDGGLRSLVVGGVTVLFAGAALLLMRARLRFSAEAVGVLALVFVLIDVQSVAALSASTPVRWLLGAGSLGVSAVLLLVVGARARIRSWFGAGLIAATAVPALAAYASPSPWVVAAGHLGAAAIALGATGVLRRKSRLAVSGRADRVVVLTLELVWTSVAVIGALMAIDDVGASLLCAVLAVSAGLALASVRSAPRVWSTAFGLCLVASGALVPLALPSSPQSDASVLVAAVPLGAAVASLLVAAVLRLLPATRAAAALAAASVVSVTAIPALVFALVLVAAVPLALLGTAVDFSAPQPLAADLQISTLVGVVAAAIAWAGPGWALRARRARLARAWSSVACWLLATSLTGLAALAVLPVGARAAVAVGTAALVAGVLLLARRRSLTRRHPWVHVSFATTAHGALLLSAAWVLIGGGPLLALAVPVLVAAVPVALLVRSDLRYLHVASALTFALLVTARLLALTGAEPIAVLALTTCAAAVVALIATLVRRVPTSWWYAVLVVTSVPFLIGVASVLAVRSGWTALSTTLILLVAVALVATPRAGLARAIRVGAAALLVPALAVIVVCLGAQVLAVSASPVTLPFIAGVVALALPGSSILRRLLTAVPLPERDVHWCALAVEASSLLTAALAVLLALARTAAGFGTSALVLGILGAGLLLSARITRRGYAAPLAGAAFAGALWSLLAMAEVGVFEAYSLPPALVAAGIGIRLSRRGGPVGLGLAAGGLAAVVVPSLVLLTVGASTPAAASLRLWILTAASVGASAAAVLLTRRSGRTGLVAVLALTGMTAATAPAIEAVRVGLRLDPVPGGPDPTAVMALSAAASVLSALLALAASLPLHRAVGPATRRWLAAPALAALAVGPIAARGESWFAIALPAVLALAVLMMMVLTAARLRRSLVTVLPPVWFQFLVAWTLAVASWSERELRVEAYSLPLGLALLAAGILWLRRDASAETANASRTSIDSWPAGFSGSWWLLSPGLVVLLLPSILATGTDPVTWRAILVIAVAILVVLIGSLRKLAAPFILGIVVLPIENAVVFLVQIGESISAAPWWITLATAGAVLLVIAVTYERRTGQDRGVAARLRDLT